MVSIPTPTDSTTQNSMISFQSFLNHREKSTHIWKPPIQLIKVMDLLLTKELTNVDHKSFAFDLKMKENLDPLFIYKASADPESMYLHQAH